MTRLRNAGWPGGRVPGAEVAIRRTAAPVATLSASTDSLGLVRFDSLLTGNYEISALRALTVAEVARLAPEDADVDASISTTPVSGRMISQM